MCRSSSDVLARPRRPPPESSVESSAPESAKLILRVAESCGVAHQSPPPSPVAVPARVVPTSPPKSSEALLESQQIRPPPESLRPVSVRVTRQALQGRPPSQSRPPSSARVRPRVPIVQSAAKVWQGRPPSPHQSRPPLPERSGKSPPESSAKSPPGSGRVVRLRRPRQGRPPSPPRSPAGAESSAKDRVKSSPNSSAVPTRVFRRPWVVCLFEVPAKFLHQGSSAVPFLGQRRPPSPPGSSAVPPSAVPARVVRRPRQGRPSSQDSLWSPHQSRPPSPRQRRPPSLPESPAIPARVARQALCTSRPRQGSRAGR